MLKRWKVAVFAATLAAGTMTAATSAQARDRYRDRNDDAALAIGAGVIGLAVGAAIASGGRDRYYRDDYYYNRQRGGYYYRSHPRNTYYYDRYDRYDRRGWRDDRRRHHRDRDFYRHDGRRGWGW